VILSSCWNQDFAQGVTSFDFQCQLGDDIADERVESLSSNPFYGFRGRTWKGVEFCDRAVSQWSCFLRRLSVGRKLHLGRKKGVDDI
jgi:hypothetical protein